MTDQTSPQTASEREDLQNHYRSAQAAAGMVGSDAGAGGTRVAASGSAVTGSIPDGTRGDLTGQQSPLVQRADGGDDPAAGAYGKAIS